MDETRTRRDVSLGAVMQAVGAFNVLDGIAARTNPDPLGAVEHAVGFVEATGREHGIEHPVQMTLGLSDGVRLWAVRYSSEGDSRTLYVSADSATLQALDPDNPRFAQMSDEDRIVVSEPLSDLPGAWLEVPEATALIVQLGADERLPFRPRTPVPAAQARSGDTLRASVPVDSREGDRGVA